MRTTEEQGNILSNVIRIAENINSVIIDGIDGYATAEQVKQIISKCLEDIRAELQKLN